MSNIIVFRLRFNGCRGAWVGETASGNAVEAREANVTEA